MTIKALHALFIKHNNISIDTRTLKDGDLFFAIKGENFNGNQYAEQALKKGASYAIIDEITHATSSRTILIENVLETLQQLASYHRDYLKIPIIALTGSNGKTTTKELINIILSKKYKTTATVGNLNNHIGVPLTLLSMDKNTEIGIVEMGANHLEEIKFLSQIAKPDFGYITNFGKAHLEGFGSIDGVIKGKTELYNYLKKYNKTIFVNTNDPKQLAHSTTAKLITFGDAITNNATINLVETQPFVKLNYNGLMINSQLIGAYNFDNISAAICIGNYFKVDQTAIKQAIEAYTPDNNRSQIITKGSTKIILDAYNANPTSMHAALHNFSNIIETTKIAFLGDMFELGDAAEKEHQDLVDLVSTLNIDTIILIGENFNKIQNKTSKTITFKSFEALKTNFQTIDTSNSTLLIKGSRGMALERILDLI